jgi:hypothetical protein
LTVQLKGFTLVAKIPATARGMGGRMKGYKVLLFRLEVALAFLTGTLGVLTLFWRDWIEALTGWSPDHHNGSVEFGLIAVLLIASLSCAAIARRTYRQLALSS